jgi:diaminopimelate epimerase
MTRELTLTKHHALGNDFLVVFHPHVADLPALARRLCDRHHGVGADGLLVAESEPGHSARMVLFNADGSGAEMSGNGIRCFAQALAARRGNLDPQLIRTDAGDRLVTLTATEDPLRIEASVDMGEVSEIDEPDGWARIGTDPMRPVHHLSLGNPHAVVGVEDVAVVDLVAIGSIVPQVNLEIIEPGPEFHAVTMRVHERGAGVTEACGTGACASAWAAASWGLVPASTPEILVHMDGGDAKVRLHQPSVGRVTLIGPAEFIATITVIVPDEPSTTPT